MRATRVSEETMLGLIRQAARPATGRGLDLSGAIAAHQTDVCTGGLPRRGLLSRMIAMAASLSGSTGAGAAEATRVRDEAADHSQ